MTKQNEPKLTTLEIHIFLMIKIGSDKEISCVELASHMLKGERHPCSPPSGDPEMRYMSICCISSTESSSVVQLVSGCSDGAMR